MENAIHMVITGQMRNRTASKYFKVPNETLRAKIKKRQKQLT